MGHPLRRQLRLCLHQRGNLLKGVLLDASKVMPPVLAKLEQPFKCRFSPWEEAGRGSQWRSPRPRRETPKPWSRTQANVLAGSTSPGWPQLKIERKKLPTIRVSLEAVACPRLVGLSGAKLTGKVKQTPTLTCTRSSSPG